MSGLDNIYATIKTQDFLIVCSFDESDTVMNTPEVRRTLNQYKNLKYFYGPDENKVGAINRDINNLTESWDILINFSDDMRFTGFGWDTTIEKIKEKYWPNTTDYFMHLWDGRIPIETPLPTMSIMGYDYYQRDRYIYNPEYTAFSCDAEAMYVALMRGCLKYIVLQRRNAKINRKWEQFSLFNHNHPAYGRGFTNDKTYQKYISLGDKDVKVYFNRMDNNFDIADAKPENIYFDPIARIAKPIPKQTFICT